MLILAYISMFIDHFGIIFFPENLVFRLIGRLALPIFAIRLSQGYKYTRNFNNYLMRILFLGIISQPIYVLTFGLGLFELFNICFILSLSLLSIHILEKIKEINKNKIVIFSLQIIALIVLIFISHIYSFEYGTYGLLMILSVYFFKDDLIKFIVSFTVISFLLIPGNMHPLQYITIFIFPILFYLDEKKFLNIDMKVLGFKYAHYLFYPLHLLLLLIIKTYV